MTAETYDDLKQYVGSKDNFTDDLLNQGFTKGYNKAQEEINTAMYYDGFNDGYRTLHREFKESFEELNKLMCEYFEKWDTRKELTELEKLALHIVTIGMQDLGAFIYKDKDTDEVSF